MEDGEGMLARFNRLMRDIENGETSRTCFRRWEVAMLVDIQSCGLDGPDRRKILHRYQNAVRHAIEKGAGEPLMLSQYLARNRAARECVEAPTLDFSVKMNQRAS